MVGGLFPTQAWKRLIAWSSIVLHGCLTVSMGKCSAIGLFSLTILGFSCDDLKSRLIQNSNAACSSTCSKIAAIPEYFAASKVFSKASRAS